MEKLVVILNKAVKDAAGVAVELDSLPGISVTSSSRSLIDIEAAVPEAAAKVRDYALEHGFDVENMTEAELIEPISPFKTR